LSCSAWADASSAVLGDGAERDIRIIEAIG
jgi:hypothetical protein